MIPLICELLAVRNISFDEIRKLQQRFVPAEITPVGRNGCRKTLVHDLYLGTAAHTIIGTRV